MRNIQGQPNLYCINTGTLGYREPIEKIIEECSARSIGYISPWRRELEGKDLKLIRRRLDDSGLKINSLCRSSYYTAPTKKERQMAIDDNKRAIDIAYELGASCYIQVVGSLYPGLKDLSKVRIQVKEGMTSLLEYSKQANIPLAVETLHPMTCADRSCITTLSEALDLCDELDPNGDYRMGVAIDVYHLWWDVSLNEQIKRASKRILAFHTSDWLVNTTDLVNDRGMPGDGCIDIKAIRAAVEDQGYLGPVELEIFSVNNWWKIPIGKLLDICVKRISQFC